MSIGSKETVANNIKHYMNINHVNATEVCNALGFKQNTFSDWINAKTYPRIDKIEMMANYFGILKSDIIEEKDNNEDIVLSPLEKEIIKSFRQSEHQDAVLTLLGVSRKKSVSELSSNVG